MLVLSGDDVQRALDADALIEALAHGLQAWSAGQANVPPRVAAVGRHGVLAVMPGHLPDVALATKLVSVFPGNHQRGLPSHQALIAMFDEETGSPLVVMDGTLITAARTAGAAAVAARALARSDASVLAVLGAGVQGRAHVDAFSRVRQLGELRIASRDRAHAEALAGADRRAMVAASFEDAASGADIICCCTHAQEPVVRSAWLAPGTHVSSVGSGPELDPELVASGRVFVEWHGAATLPPPAGAVDLQGIDPEQVTEIGEVLNGTRPGRSSDDEITVYKSTGHAVEDAAAARVVFDAARRLGLGTEIPL